MIDSVRNTVLFIINKDNRGFVTPSEFDYFAKQAQLEIFEEMFDDYSRAVAAQNSRKRSLGYGDAVSKISNNIDIFTKKASLSYSGGEFTLPADLYKLLNLTYAFKPIQEVPAIKFDMLVNSNYTKPTVLHPIYTRQGQKVIVNPTSIADAVVCNYVRPPVDPHWGYRTISGDPVYNADSSTDFEISKAHETELVVKICKYAGISIREADVVQAASTMETEDFQKENL
jgi:hypothetical protein